MQRATTLQRVKCRHWQQHGQTWGIRLSKISQEKDKYCMILFLSQILFRLSQTDSWIIPETFYFPRPSDMSIAMLAHLGEPGEQPVERLGLHMKSIHFILLCLPEFVSHLTQKETLL